MKNSPNLVWVEWEDSAQASPQWQWLDEAPGPEITLCVSVGFLVFEDEKEKRLAISVASRQGVAEQVSGVVAIPTRCIVRSGRLITSYEAAPWNDPDAESAPRQTATESAA
jgi:hypothetical protein